MLSEVPNNCKKPPLCLLILHFTVSNPSRDLTLLVELPSLSESSSQGQLLIQEVERAGGKKKVVGLATFIPRWLSHQPRHFQY